MSSEDLKKPSSIGRKPPPSLNYMSRPHIGNKSNTEGRDNNSRNVARRPIVNMEDFQSDQVTAENSHLARTNWNVEDSSLRPLPPFSLLNPSSSALVYDASPSVIAARVSDCLRDRSIMSEYNDDMATANAMTPNRVHFIIRLYRGGSPNSPFSHGVIIELQRLRGDVMTFHQSSRAILSAAQGSSSRGGGVNTRVPNNGMGLSSDNLFDGLGVDRDEENDSTNVLMALAIDWSLIKKDRTDANILGWESLALLTDEHGSGLSTALIAGRVVLGLAPTGNEEDEDEDERYAEIHASVISLLRDRQMLGGDTRYNDEQINHEGKNDADYMTAEELDHQGFEMNMSDDIEHIVVQRSLAIRILANSLEVVSRANDGRFLQNSLPNLVLNENIIPSLLDEVASSVLPNNPFNASDATHAARALAVLFANSADARHIAHSRNALSILSKARSVGRSRYAALEQAAEKAFESLNASKQE